jgi:hypothetical protein
LNKIFTLLMALFVSIFSIHPVPLVKAQIPIHTDVQYNRTVDYFITALNDYEFLCAKKINSSEVFRQKGVIFEDHNIISNATFDAITPSWHLWLLNRPHPSFSILLLLGRNNPRAP